MGKLMVAAITQDGQLCREMLWVSRLAGLEIAVFSSLDQTLKCLAPGGVLLIGSDVAAVADPELTRTPSPHLRLRVALGSTRAPQPDAYMLPGDAQRLVHRLDEITRPAAGAVVAGIVGARGGVGASVLAAATARAAAAAGRATCLVDADCYAGGIDVLVGTESEAATRWSDLLAGEGAHAIASLPRWHKVAVLSAGTQLEMGADPALLGAVVDSLRAAHDLLVIDIGGGWASVGKTRLMGWCDAVVLLAGLDLRSVAGSLRLLAETASPPLLAVRLPGSGRLTVAQVSEALELPVAVRVRREMGLAADLEHGGAPGDRRRRAVARAGLATFRAIEAGPHG